MNFNFLFDKRRVLRPTALFRVVGGYDYWSIMKRDVSKKTSLMVMGIATLGILGAGSLGVSALAPNSTQTDGLAERLASRFGLDKGEVSKEVNAYHNEERVKHEA